MYSYRNNGNLTAGLAVGDPRESSFKILYGQYLSNLENIVYRRRGERKERRVPLDSPDRTCVITFPSRPICSRELPPMFPIRRRNAAKIGASLPEEREASGLSQRR